MLVRPVDEPRVSCADYNDDDDVVEILFDFRHSRRRRPGDPAWRAARERFPPGYQYTPDEAADVVSLHRILLESGTTVVSGAPGTVGDEMFVRCVWS
jgi:hypothetical protein